MKINITARHFELTEDVRQYIVKKLEKVETFFDRLIEANAILTLEKHRYSVELDAFASRASFHAEVEMHDLFAAIDSTVEKISRQSRRFKSRIRDKRGRASIAEAIESLASDELSTDYEFESESDQGTFEINIVKADKCPPKPMLPEEAAMQLKLSKDIFLAFMNARSSQLNVIYKKNDGNFGWIEPN